MCSRKYAKHSLCSHTFLISPADHIDHHSTAIISNSLIWPWPKSTRNTLENERSHVPGMQIDTIELFNSTSDDQDLIPVSFGSIEDQWLRSSPITHAKLPIQIGPTDITPQSTPQTSIYLKSKIHQECHENTEITTASDAWGWTQTFQSISHTWESSQVSFRDLQQASSLGLTLSDHDCITSSIDIDLPKH